MPAGNTWSDTLVREEADATLLSPRKLSLIVSYLGHTAPLRLQQSIRFFSFGTIHWVVANAQATGAYATPTAHYQDLAATKAQTVAFSVIPFL